MSCEQFDGDVNQTVNLSKVSEDIHRLIISELVGSSPSAVLNLAKTSQTLRDAALPFVYRDIVLEKGPKGSGKNIAYKTMMNIFRKDKPCQIARHIRSITVRGDVPSDDLMAVLDHIADGGRLQTIKWNTSAHMSLAVFEKLHTTWPQLEVFVSVIDRRDAKVVAHRQMDMKLLSSPLLVGLTYVVYSKGYQPDQPCRSEWPKLSQALTAGGNVRSLHIQSQQDGTEYYGVKIVPDSEPEELPRLNLAGMHLPRLEELRIRIQGSWGDLAYPWDDEHCRMLRTAVDCSRLRTLDFGSDTPKVFFECFNGILPALKSLRFGISHESDSASHAARFIESAPALETLDIDRAQRGVQQLWPVIRTQKDTLKRLILRPTFGDWYGIQYLDRMLLETVAKEFPKLEHLGWHIPCEANYLSVLSTMNLKKLDLFLHIPSEASAYSEKLIQNAMGTIAPPPLNKKSSIKAATDIARHISEQQANELDSLTLHISRTGFSDRAQPYLMFSGLQLRRDECEYKLNNANYSVRGNMEWCSLSSLEEEIMFNEE